MYAGIVLRAFRTLPQMMIVAPGGRAYPVHCPSQLYFVETQPYFHHPTNPLNFDCTSGDRDAGFAALKASTGASRAQRAAQNLYITVTGTEEEHA